VRYMCKQYEMMRNAATLILERGLSRSRVAPMATATATATATRWTRGANARGDAKTRAVTTAVRAGDDDDVRVRVFWDADNLRARLGDEATTLARVVRAASAFGRVDGDVAAFGNGTTLGRTSFDGVGGVDVRVCGDEEDDADVALAEALMEWARREAGGEGEGDVVFTTKRRRVKDGVSEEEEARAVKMAEMWAERAREVREALPKRTYARDETVESIIRGRSRVAVVVTSDNDLKLAMDYACCHGVAVVVLGNLSPNATGGKSAMKTKKGRSSVKRMGTLGMNKDYWDAVKSECERRQLSRLKLLQSSDGALLWDPNRLFDGDGAKPVAGDVVGVWSPMSGRSGVGRWYHSASYS